MGADDIRSEQADPRQILDGGEAVVVPAFLDLERGFGHMDQKRRLGALG